MTEPATTAQLLEQGLFHHRRGDIAQAMERYTEVLRNDPQNADALYYVAAVACQDGQFKEGVALARRAISFGATQARVHNLLGKALDRLGEPLEAIKCFDAAIATDPKFAEAHVNRANALKDLGHLDAASGLPGSPRFDEAEAAYSKAIALEPRLDEAYFGRGLLALLRGDWAAGFADYEHREKVGEPTFVPLPGPRWDGEPRTGERVVLVSEQGLSDTIQFCRFAPLLAARGFDVTILTRKAMAPLLATLAGVTIATEPDALAQDPRPLRWLPLLSVPGVLGIRPDSVPADVPYLSAQPARVEAWRARLGEGRFKIGINWSSGHSDKAHFTLRDIALADFAAVAALPGVQLISLQKGAAAAQTAEVAFRDKIMTIDADPQADADFFLDTASVMSLLDLVVTCDTSVAHLAGALTRPVFTALPVIADWRWLIDRNDTPWYPTMRLFRQDAGRQWQPVIARIVEAVRGLVSARIP